jgi:hypothetical protein
MVHKTLEAPMQTQGGAAVARPSLVSFQGLKAGIASVSEISALRPAALSKPPAGVLSLIVLFSIKMPISGTLYCYNLYQLLPQSHLQSVMHMARITSVLMRCIVASTLSENVVKSYLFFLALLNMYLMSPHVISPYCSNVSTVSTVFLRVGSLVYAVH